MGLLFGCEPGHGRELRLGRFGGGGGGGGAWVNLGVKGIVNGISYSDNGILRAILSPINYLRLPKKRIFFPKIYEYQKSNFFSVF